MRHFAKLIILIPIAILAAVLSLANRGPVTLSLDPFRPEAPALSLTLPLFVVVFVALIAGVIVGGVAAWLSQGKWRRAARQRRQEVAALRRQAESRLPEIGAGLPATLPRP